MTTEQTILKILDCGYEVTAQERCDAIRKVLIGGDHDMVFLLVNRLQELGYEATHYEYDESDAKTDVKDAQRRLEDVRRNRAITEQSLRGARKELRDFCHPNSPRDGDVRLIVPDHVDELEVVEEIQSHH